MRLAIAMYLVLSVSGCSVMIARAGLDIGSLQTRDDVHATFGQPVSASLDGSHRVETFRTRRKLADSYAGYGMEFVMHFGTREPRNTWTELAKWGRTLVHGQEVEFRFDGAGNVDRSHLGTVHSLSEF